MISTMELTPKNGNHDINLWCPKYNFYARLTYKKVSHSKPFKEWQSFFTFTPVEINTLPPFKRMENDFEISMDCARLSYEEFKEKYLK